MVFIKFLENEVFVGDCVLDLNDILGLSCIFLCKVIIYFFISYEFKGFGVVGRLFFKL